MLDHRGNIPYPPSALERHLTFEPTDFLVVNTTILFLANFML